MKIITGTKIVTYITFGFASAITLYPYILFRKEFPFEKDLIHEKIHFEQQKELGPFKFYLRYLVEWLGKGYKNISFEKEAYQNEYNGTYLKNRVKYSFNKYL
jgi:hypothetical protein